MRTTWLRVRAPFAAYRWMQAGVYRATFPTMPPSAAWGLVLNLAGIDIRGDTSGVTTTTDPGAPRLRIAVGSLRTPEVVSLYQQLHSYPVGSSGKELKPLAQGNKYWVAPARRELLVGLDVMLGVRAEDPSLIDRVGKGLRGELGDKRYGLPFAGDNSLLFDSIDELPEPEPARWFLPVPKGAAARKGTCRLTVDIDRQDSSRTRTVLMAPAPEPSSTPPDAAWVWTPSAPS